MSSSNNTVVLSREEVHSDFHEKVADAFDNKSHKKRIGCGHIKGLIKQIRGDNNTLEGALCDIIDNVDGIASRDKLSNVGCWVEMLYDEENGKIHQIKITDNLPNGFNGLDNEGTDHPLNMTHMRVGHSEDNESSEFGTGLKKALVYIGNSCEIYTRSIENGRDMCRYVKLDFVEMSQRKNAEDSYELTISKEISYDEYRQYHNKEFGSTIIISNIRDNSICSYTDKQMFERKIKDYLSLKFTERFRVGSFLLHLNDEKIDEQPDVYTGNDNKFTYTFYIKIVNNAIVDIVVCKINHRGLTKKYKFGMVTKKDKKGKETQNFAFTELDKKIKFEDFKSSSEYCELIFESCSTSQTEFDNIRRDNEVDIIRMRNHGHLNFYKQKGDGYSNYISNRIKYSSKKLNTFLGVSSFKVVSLKENILTSALTCAQTDTTKHFVSQRRKECKENNLSSNSNSDDDISVISSISSVTSSSVTTKKKSVPVAKKAALVMPQAPPPSNTNSNSNSNAIYSSSSDEETNINTIAVVVSSPLTETAVLETNANVETAVADNNLTGFGISVPVSATQRVNLAVKDGLEVMSQILEKEDLVINMSGLNSLLSMYLDGANSKTKLRILQQLVSEKYTPEDSNKHMLGGAELVRLSNAN